jgi:hypothetical protein
MGSPMLDEINSELIVINDKVHSDTLVLLIVVTSLHHCCEQSDVG